MGSKEEHRHIRLQLQTPDWRASGREKTPADINPRRAPDLRTFQRLVRDLKGRRQPLPPSRGTIFHHTTTAAGLLGNSARAGETGRPGSEAVLRLVPAGCVAAQPNARCWLAEQPWKTLRQQESGALTAEAGSGCILRRLGENGSRARAGRTAAGVGLGAAAPANPPGAKRTNLPIPQHQPK